MGFRRFDIAFCCDNGYVPYLLVAINSVCLSNKKRDIYFHIFSEGLHNENIDKIVNVVKDNGQNCKFYIIDKNNLKNIRLDKLDKRITIATCYRFFVPQLLNGIIDRVLYLDVDLCVCGCLDELFNCNMHNKVIGAVLEKIPYSERLNIEKYFNAGVLLIDINKWMDKDLTSVCIEELSNNSYPMADQDVLNIKLENDKYILSEMFNYKYNLDSYKESNYMPPANVCVIHFLSESKPWCMWTKYFSVIQKIYNTYIPQKYPLKLLEPRTSTQMRKMVKNSFASGNYFESIYYSCLYVRGKIIGFK